MERKRLLQEKQKAAKEAFRRTQEKKRSDLRERRQEKVEENKKERGPAKSDPADMVLKARLKAEKLRRLLNKEEKKVAKAEAKAEQARVEAQIIRNDASFPQSVVAGIKRKRGEGDGAAKSISCISGAPAVSVKQEFGDDNGNEEPNTQPTVKIEQSPNQLNVHDVSLEEMIAAASTHVTEYELMESHALVANPDGAPEPRAASGIVSNLIKRELSPLEGVVKTESESDDTMSISSSSPEPSSDDDDTSSSGSLSDDGAPEEAPSKKDRPERVPPPKRERPKSVCIQFLKTGYCKRGNRCHFLHELPERGRSQAGLADGKKARRKGGEEPKAKRKTLYERVRMFCLHYRLIS